MYVKLKGAWLEYHHENSHYISIKVQIETGSGSSTDSVGGALKNISLELLETTRIY